MTQDGLIGRRRKEKSRLNTFMKPALAKEGGSTRA
jgi:hypothetical protein